MKSRKNGTLDIDLKRALGASRVIPLNAGKIATPIDLLALREEILSHLSSEEEAGTGKGSIVEYEIPLHQETWVMLQEMSDQLEKVGTSTAPEQLAAFFIKEGLLRYKQGEHCSRSRTSLPDTF